VKDLTPHAVQSCHELLLWLLPLLDKLPRVRRFTLGERIESALHEPRPLLRLRHPAQEAGCRRPVADFDAVYQELIASAIVEAERVPLCLGEEMTGGAIYRLFRNSQRTDLAPHGRPWNILACSRRSGKRRHRG
jgi:hypothetical protein